MTYEAALKEIQELGFQVIATTSFEGTDRAYDASNGQKLARGPKAATSDEAMAGLLRVVYSKA